MSLDSNLADDIDADECEKEYRSTGVKVYLRPANGAPLRPSPCTAAATYKVAQFGDVVFFRRRVAGLFKWCAAMKRPKEEFV